MKVADYPKIQDDALLEIAKIDTQIQDLVPSHLLPRLNKLLNKRDTLMLGESDK